MEYTLIRSLRRTLSVTVDRNGEVVVRAPKRMPKMMIDRFLLQKESWILEHQKNALAKPYVEAFSEEELKELKKRAKKLLLPMVEAYAKELGVTYHRVAIRAQKTRWGSCSRDGNLNFNCLLVLVPEPVARYVVVHELCHRMEMNHSKAFWAKVAMACPNYKAERKWLKENGTDLIARLS